MKIKNHKYLLKIETFSAFHDNYKRIFKRCIKKREKY